MKQVLKIDEWFHPDGFPISVERREPQEQFGPHAHEFTELVIVTGGKGLHVTGQDSWELTAGDVFVIAGPREHEYRDMRELKLVNILYQPSRLEAGLMDYKTFTEDSLVITINENIANVRFVAGIKALLGGKEADLHLHVLEVWVKKTKRWVLFARQAVK